jgi:hypothetical protein
MSDYPTLDAKVFGANGEGQTVREIMALGCGRAYQQLRGLEGWPQIVAAYEAECAKVADALPLKKFAVS